MKKTLLLMAVALMSVFTVNAQNEQFVSTTPSNKNVVLEEYTGINCGYCPDGHKIANQIMDSHPGRVFVINVHAGGYAANTYTTQFGNALANQTNLDGYPSGTVNRHVFSNGITALNRGSWTGAANTILNQSSPVNIAARGTLDWSTRELNITVQLYYTSAEANATNKLNIAIIQDNVIGSQSGSSLNPAQVVGSQYRHMHMLRHLITGQWGEDVTPTTAGSFVEKTYTYTIPASLGSPNAIAAKLEDLQFIAFVAQGNQEILTGCEVEIENVNMPALSPRLDGVANVEILNCASERAVKATVSNVGSDALTALTFEYSVANGAPQTYQWTGNIASMQSSEIQLPNFNINTNTNQVIKVKITNANGTAFETDEKSVTIKKLVANGGGTMTIKLKTDQYSAGSQGTENSFKIYGPNNNVVMNVPSSQLTPSTVNEFTWTPTEDGCYRIELKDTYGDGITSGYLRLYDANNSQILNMSASSSFTLLNAMVAVGTVDIDDMTISDEMVVFPNPTSNYVNIQTAQTIQQVEVYNLQGQRVAAEIGNTNQISFSNLANGLYIMKVTTDNGVSTFKVNKR
ncbi:MAG: Omp28-related outer membrane protein [Bacteroidales bacterium]|nr:Omp28-related outer membrane protein [Bacteroidales bacterium]